MPRYEEGWEWGIGYTVVTYVGYDDNRSMRNKGVRIQGSNGALPVWIGTAKAMARAGLLGEPESGTWARMKIEDGFSVVPVADGTGLPLQDVPEEIQRSVLIAGAESVTKRFAPAGMAVPTSMDLVSPHGGGTESTPEPSALEDWLGDEPASVWQQIEAPPPPPAEGVIGDSP